MAQPVNATQTFIVRVAIRHDLTETIDIAYVQFLLQEGSWLDVVSIEQVKEISLTNQQGDK